MELIFSRELQELEIHGIYHPSEQDECGDSVDIKLDVSKNIKMRKFFCEARSIEQLDLSSLVKLKKVDLYAEEYEKLPYPTQDLSNCLELSEVRVGTNVILPEQMPNLVVCELWGGDATMNFQKFPKLQKLTLSGKFTAGQLNLSNMPKLQTFTATISGGVERIDLSNCKYLKTVNTQGWIKAVELKGCTNLRKLIYHGYYLGKLDVTKFGKLTYLDCQGQRIRKLNLSKNKELAYLNCARNELKKLNLKNNTKLKTVNCDDNSLTGLWLSAKARYKSVSCKNNKLKRLNAKGINVKVLKTKGNRKITVLRGQNKR